MKFGKSEEGEWLLLMENIDEISTVCHGLIERVEVLKQDLHGQGEEDLNMAERAHIITEIQNLSDIIEPMQGAIMSEHERGSE